MKVIVEFELENWESFKNLIEYLMGDTESFMVSTNFPLHVSDLKKSKVKKA